VPPAFAVGLAVGLRFSVAPFDLALLPALLLKGLVRSDPFGRVFGSEQATPVGFS